MENGKDRHDMEEVIEIAIQVVSVSTFFSK